MLSFVKFECWVLQGPNFYLLTILVIADLLTPVLSYPLHIMVNRPFPASPFISNFGSVSNSLFLPWPGPVRASESLDLSLPYILLFPRQYDLYRGTETG